MKTQVLDHGYVELVESWGSDERIIEAARMSTNKGFQGWEHYVCEACGCKWRDNGDDTMSLYDAQQKSCEVCEWSGLEAMKIMPGDTKLLRYLWEHKHATPFEMAGMTIEVQAPIFVFREWHRHRTQSYNEMSARYTPLPDVNYLPTVERMLVSDGKNKQAQGVGPVPLSREGAEQIQNDLAASYRDAERLYQRALLLGVPKEVARVILPVGRYSRMRASANLRNWLAFLTLRLDGAAQWEIRQYAIAVADLVREKFPRTYSLFRGTD